MASPCLPVVWNAYSFRIAQSRGAIPALGACALLFLYPHSTACPPIRQANKQRTTTKGSPYFCIFSLLFSSRNYSYSYGRGNSQKSFFTCMLHLCTLHFYLSSALVLHQARNQRFRRAGFPPDRVVVLGGRQPARVLRLVRQKPCSFRFR